MTRQGIATMGHGKKNTHGSPKSRLPTNDLELFVPHKQSRKKQKSTAMASRTRWYAALLAVGLVGTLACLWAMIYTAQSEKIANTLGMARVANSMENILNHLAYPVLMFTVILSAYASQRLYQLYKASSHPKHHRS